MSWSMMVVVIVMGSMERVVVPISFVVIFRMGPIDTMVVMVHIVLIMVSFVIFVVGRTLMVVGLV